MNNGTAKFNGTYLLVNEDSSDYTCCCGCCHVKTGATLVGLINIVVALAVLLLVTLSKASMATSEEVTLAHVINAALGFALITFAVFVMFAGIRRGKACLLLPFLIIQVICIVALIIWVVYGIAAVISASRAVDESQLIRQYPMGPADNEQDNATSTLSVDVVNNSTLPSIKVQDSTLSDDGEVKSTLSLGEFISTLSVDEFNSTLSTNDTDINEQIYIAIRELFVIRYYRTVPLFLVITVHVIYLLIGITIQVWFFVVVFKCYRYLRSKVKFTLRPANGTFDYGTAKLK